MLTGVHLLLHQPILRRRFQARQEAPKTLRQEIDQIIEHHGARDFTSPTPISSAPADQGQDRALRLAGPRAETSALALRPGERHPRETIRPWSGGHATS